MRSNPVGCSDGFLGNGDNLGTFVSMLADESACDVEIGRLKILCGWNSPNVSERRHVPEAGN
jgi:hypothetical protein